MDEIRISNVARYTANFTAPTEQFVTDANTKLLIHGDGRQGTNSFRDSTPGLAFVPSADISVEYLVVGGGGEPWPFGVHRVTHSRSCAMVPRSAPRSASAEETLRPSASRVKSE